MTLLKSIAKKGAGLIRKKNAGQKFLRKRGAALLRELKRGWKNELKAY